MRNIFHLNSPLRFELPMGRTASRPEKRGEGCKNMAERSCVQVVEGKER